jgi:peptide/nickel transport system permease protein
MINDAMRENMTTEALDALFAQFGLVRNPDIFDWIYMFWRYIANSFTGNFGYSFVSRRPVVDEIMARLPNTLLLMGTASIVSIIIGIWSGVKVATDPGSRKDVGAVTVALFIYSLPIFWLGMVFLLVFAYGLEWFPAGGTVDWAVWNIAAESPLGAIIIAGHILHHLVLPMITLGIGSYGYYFLYMRNNLITVMTEDYILTARAKGLDEYQVLYKHGMKNALLPMVTVIALTFGGLITGATLTETVFDWWGMGRYLFDSLLLLDFPVIQAIFMIIAITSVLANFIADLLYGVLDPRIKYT